MKLRRLFRWRFVRNGQSPHGVQVIAVGLRIGYWPCLKAPFVQFALTAWRLELWHGYPSKDQIAKGE